MRTVYRYAFIIVVILILVEFLSFVYFGVASSKNGSRPVYAKKDTTRYWRTESELWGAWHVANSQARHFEQDCFDLPVRANSYGARDRERTRKGENRILVLGDSFIEGWGVVEEKRLTNVMEKELQKEILNFGSDYWFGPLQYEILYRELASKFQHDLLIIGLAPHNDFTDNDLNQWQTKKAEDRLVRFRPYYAKDGQTAIYPTERPAQKDIPISDLPFYQPFGFGYIKDIGRSYFWSYYWLPLLKRTVFGGTSPESVGHINPYVGYSGYRDFKEQQLANVLGSLHRMVNLAKQQQRDVLVALLPSKFDFFIGQEENRLAPIVREFATKNGIYMIDILEVMNYREEYFQPCNWFWSEEGHQKVAEILSRRVANMME